MLAFSGTASTDDPRGRRRLTFEGRARGAIYGRGLQRSWRREIRARSRSRLGSNRPGSEWRAQGSPCSRGCGYRGDGSCVRHRRPPRSQPQRRTEMSNSYVAAIDGSAASARCQSGSSSRLCLTSSSVIRTIGVATFRRGPRLRVGGGARAYELSGEQSSGSV